MGADFDGLHECATCSGQIPGFTFEEVSPLDQFEVDPTKDTCPMCKGYGSLRSGSKTDNALVMCMRCTGNGYVNKEVPQPPQWNPGSSSNTYVPEGYLPASSDQMPTRDLWGRQLGHPHFGMDPSSIGV
jgi:hypothetical protein